MRLFKYDRYANELIAGNILKTGITGKPVELMAHLLTAQQVWLNRCTALPAISVIWPALSSDTFGDLIAKNSQDWLNYLETLQPGDFEKTVGYRNSKGIAFEDRVEDILAHVINHGTHHRAQIGQFLKAAGVELPPTDYIFYIRTLNC